MLKKVVMMLFLGLFFFFPAEVFAQPTPELAVVVVNLWPEFDQPSVLVIYDIILGANQGFPAEIGISIPRESGLLNALAARQSDGQLYNIPYEQFETGEWTRVIFQAPSPEIRLEYYDSGLTIEGIKRRFEYRWPGNYAVADFRIKVQQPVGVTKMLISPSLGAGIVASDGLVYYGADVGPLSAGQSFNIALEYQKEDDQLTYNSIYLAPAGPLDESTPGRINFLEALPWLFGVLGLVLIIGGGYWYWRSGRTKGPTGGTPSIPPTTGQLGSQDEEGFVYCHKCGKRALPGDRYCRTCGAQLRVG